MNKFSLRFGVAVMVVCQLASVSSVALASETTGGTVSTPKADVLAPAAPAAVTLVPVSDGIQAFMEVFFANLKVKYFDQAYGVTTENFRKNMPMKEFKKMVTATRLVDFVSKKWIGDETKTAGLDMITGEFTGADDVVRSITFTLSKKDASYAINSMTEILSPELLLKLFPTGDAQHALITSDLALIRKTIKNRSYIRLYNTMSRSVRNTVKFKNFKKSLADFRKEKHDITVPKDETFTLNDGYPKVNPNGTVTVKGHYLNSANDVQFDLTYEYAWEWKLSGLNVNPVSLTAKPEEKK